MNTKSCPGCNDPEPQDHYHQYINVRGNAVQFWQIEGIAYDSSTEAIERVMTLYEVSKTEAISYITGMRKKYN